MKRIILLGLAATACNLAVVSVNAKPFTYPLPDETAAFKPGPNLDLVQANCGGCHSADYILTQPQGAKFKMEFWQTEVAKMITVFGAPIAADDVPKIVDYLTATH